VLTTDRLGVCFGEVHVHVHVCLLFNIKSGTLCAGLTEGRTAGRRVGFNMHYPYGK
jgi:hypothetical protein